MSGLFLEIEFLGGWYQQTFTLSALATAFSAWEEKPRARIQIGKRDASEIETCNRVTESHAFQLSLVLDGRWMSHLVWARQLKDVEFD